MKFTSIALITIVGYAAANPVIIQEDAPAFADVPVSVSVFCNGKIDWTKLSLPQSSVVGKILVESYNNVHDKLNNDDSKLRDLIFRSERLLQVDDETHLDAWFKPTGSKGAWTGMWGCTECPDDDTPDVSGPVLKAWQNEFIAGLLESKMPIFQGIRNCVIDMGSGEDVPRIDIPNADVEMNCGKKFDLSKLTVSMGAFLSHALQTSYNKVHAINADDDSELSNVFFFRKPIKVENDMTMLSRNPGYHVRYAPSLSGWWGCRLCHSGNDDDMLSGRALNSTMAMKRYESQLSAATTGPLLEAWESELIVALQSSPFTPFKKIEWCDLKLVPHKKVALKDVEEEAINVDSGCGLRGGCNSGDVTME